MSKESWFDAFERNLAESGWFDAMDRDDLYEKAGEDAFDEVRTGLSQLNLEEERNDD